MIPFEPRPWEDERREYLERPRSFLTRGQQTEASGWIGAALVIIVVATLLLDVGARFFK